MGEAGVAVGLVHRVLPAIELRLEGDDLPTLRDSHDVCPAALVIELSRCGLHVPGCAARMQTGHERTHERGLASIDAWLRVAGRRVSLALHSARTLARPTQGCREAILRLSWCLSRREAQRRSGHLAFCLISQPDRNIPDRRKSRPNGATDGPSLPENHRSHAKSARIRLIRRIILCCPENQRQSSRLYGGEGGIRTPGTLAGTTDFESAAFDHSATSPRPRVAFEAGGEFYQAGEIFSAPPM